MRIYLAAPLFSEAERTFNEKVAKKLREANFEVLDGTRINLLKMVSKSRSTI